jgi:hypothetical protein
MMLNKDLMYRWLHNIQIFIFRCALWFEVVISLLIFVGCIVEISGSFKYILTIGHGGFDNYLQYLFDILIGLELIKMLSRQDLDSMVEVLLFAVARYLLIGHRPIQEFLVGVVAIAGLFGIRKFLFIPHSEKDEIRKRSDYLQKDR